MPTLPYQPAPEIHQVEMRFLWLGQQCEMVFHTLNGDTDPTLDEVIPFGDFWTDIRAILAANISLVDIRVVDLTSEDGAVVVQPVNSLGAVLTDSVANSLAPCVTLRTVRRGRSYTGRKYLPGLAVGYLTNNTIGPVAVAAINSAFEELRAECLGSGRPLCVLSRQLNGDRRPFAVGTAVTSATLRDNVIDNQRRRKPGNGS